jgi:hypothetical protein
MQPSKRPRPTANELRDAAPARPRCLRPRGPRRPAGSNEPRGDYLSGRAARHPAPQEAEHPGVGEGTCRRRRPGHGAKNRIEAMMMPPSRGGRCRRADECEDDPEGGATVGKELPQPEGVDGRDHGGDDGRRDDDQQGDSPHPGGRRPGVRWAVGFPCRGAASVPVCGGRRMAERTTHLVDHALVDVPIRQWALSLPPRLRHQVAWDHDLCRAVAGRFIGEVLGSLRPRARDAGLLARIIHERHRDVNNAPAGADSRQCRLRRPSTCSGRPERGRGTRRWRALLRASPERRPVLGRSRSPKGELLRAP